MISLPRAAFRFAARLMVTFFIGEASLLHLRAADLPIPVSGRNEPSLAAIDELVSSFIRHNKVPGAAVAITRGGRLVYAKGFGWADVDGQQPMQPNSLFRIASISKSFTAAAILKLSETHAINVSDHAFPFLGIKPILPPGKPVDPRLDQITIWQLLHHSGGFDREQTFDPALHTLDIAHSLNTPPPVNPTQIIQYMMGQPLGFDPGTQVSYSNLGYSVLGRDIEKASGKSYEDYVKTEILKPLGISDMRLGHTFAEGRAAGEVTYYSARHPKPGPSAFGEGLKPYPYGVWCLESMDAFAGWIATPIDLVKFANALDRTEASPILSKKSIEQIFARPETTGYYSDGTQKEIYMGCGWYARVMPEGRTITYHRGLLDGTSTLLVRGGNGTDWAVFFNSDTSLESQELAVVIDPMIRSAIDSIQEWPTYDLYGEFN